MKKVVTYVPILFSLLFLLGCGEKEKKESKPASPPPTTMQEQESSTELLVGTFTGEGSEGIYKLDFNTETGELGNKTLLVVRENPGYLDISRDRSRVYSSNSGTPGSLSIFEFNTDRSGLRHIGDYSSEGDGACFIELSKNENLVAAANYGSGSIVLYSLDTKGMMVSGTAQKQQHKGSSTSPRQKSAHAHCVKFDDTGKTLYAVDLGMDAVVAYPLGSDGRWGKGHTALKTRPGDGPRHMIFHPTKNMAFVINELSNTVISAKVDAQKAKFEIIDQKSTLPDDFKDESFCADIHLSPDNRFLYASNRGHNSIAIFSVSEEGQLEFLGTEPVRGDWPRNFTLSPDGRFLLAANQKSGNITVFNVNRATGLLSYTGHELKMSQPVCLKF
ncbi:MAG: lactonase family protein [Bacteroidota bacterium]